MTGWATYVLGDPVSQGSKRHVGNGVMIEASKNLRPWRATRTGESSVSAIEIHRNTQDMVIDHAAVLKSLNLDPSQPKTQALLLVCDRYGLDPLLKHAILMQGSLYITRDGYLAVAHRSGHFDGIEVIETGETKEHWTAKVAVYRDDMGRPFTYIGRYPKTGGNKAYGPEMAIKCAEVMALRRAFNVTGLPAADERWDTDQMYQRPVDVETGEIVALPAPTPPAEAVEKIDTIRRRPPPSRPGMVSAKDAKEALIQAFRNRGSEDPVEAAKALWAGRGSKEIPQDQLDRTLAEIDAGRQVEPDPGEPFPPADEPVQLELVATPFVRPEDEF